MDAAEAAEASQRVTKWIEETRQLFTMLPGLVVTDAQVHERVSTVEKEIERLRKELDEVKRENHLLRSERDDIAHAMSQVAQRLGFTPRKSPFERTHAGDHPKPGDHPRAGEQPKAGEPPKAEHPKI
jgi:septal ring factor EnvC (AmiA/AmiB activator)